MDLIDSHCHLEHFYKKGILDEILENAKRDGITQVITVGTQAQDWSLYQELTSRHRGTIYYTVGLHPSYVGEDWEEQISRLAHFFKDNPSPVALGEIGLDFFRLPKSIDEAKTVKMRQVAAFKRQLMIALELNCPLVVHTRGTFHECVKLIDEAGIDWRKETEVQMKAWGVKYHKLFLGKPGADIYIDDKAVNIKDWVQQNSINEKL